MRSKLVGIVLVLLSCSCVRVDTGETMPTLGEQIIDLARAREAGVISSEEFKKMRRRVLAAF